MRPTPPPPRLRLVKLAALLLPVALIGATTSTSWAIPTGASSARKGTLVYVQDADASPDAYLRLDSGQYVRLTGDIPPTVSTTTAYTPVIATKGISDRTTIDASTLLPAPQDVPPATYSAMSTAAGQKVWVVRATWDQGPSLSSVPSFENISAGLNSTSAYWSEVTTGRVTFTLDKTFDNITASAPPSCSDSAAFINSVIAQTKWTQSAGAHLLVEIPQDPHIFSQCAGLALLGASLDSGGWVILRGLTDVSIMGHELGHNLGFRHSNTAQCQAGSAIATLSSTCISHDYFNTYSIMGISFIGSPPGWPDGKQLVQTHLTVPRELTTATSFTISPIASHVATKVAHFTTSNHEQVYVEYRYPVGLDSQVGKSLMRLSGVLVNASLDSLGASSHIGTTTSTFIHAASYLLDANPLNTADPSKVGQNSMTLPLGKWVNIAGAALRLTSLSGTDATIDYNPSYGPAIDATRPSPPTWTMSHLASQGGRSVLSWQPGSQTGVTYVLSSDLSDKTDTTRTRTYLGWSQHIGQRRTVACSASSCAASAFINPVTPARPLTWAVSNPVIGDGSMAATVTGFSSTEHYAWRLFWCDQSISGASCDPLTAKEHGYTSALTSDAASLNLQLLSHRVLYQGRSVIQRSGTGTYKRNDYYRLTLVTYRSAADHFYTRGMVLNARPYDSLVYRP